MPNSDIWPVVRYLHDVHFARGADNKSPCSLGEKSPPDGPAPPFKVERLTREGAMLRWAMLFLIIALVAGGLGLSGAVEGMALNIAYILFVIFIILFIIGLVTGRRPPVA